MISLEQVQLLETKVAKAIEYVQKVTEENSALISERAGLLSKLEANQKRLDELEVLVMRFKEDQGRIEGGIIAALDRLSQFEEAFENSLKEKTVTKKPAKTAKQEAPAAREEANSVCANPVSAKEFFEISKPISEEKKENNSKKENADDDEAELDIF
ncbi:MAG: cell division protein ZapB [Treponema sp.]|nr:cell division protein ZapB [Treponema sp.]MCL2251327.1 cell division protein ZapB [Treponema sp.]